MMALHDLFKIILSIILSASILIFAVSYTSGYSAFQEDLSRAKIIANFRSLALETYLSGVSQGYTDFRRTDMGFAFDHKENSLNVDEGSFPLSFPLLFVKSETVYLDRLTEDHGWWRFNYVLSSPGIKIAFATDGSADSWNIVREIVSAFPEEEYSKNSITFALCDGSRLLERLCDGECGRDGFLRLLQNPGGAGTEKCSARPKNVYKLITVSSSCLSSAGGLCISAGGSAAKMHAEGSRRELVYRSPHDAVFLLLGGVGGYDYWISRLKAEALKALEIKSKESEITVRDMSRFAADIRLAEGNISAAINSQSLFISEKKTELAGISQEGERKARERLIELSESRKSVNSQCLSLYGGIRSLLSGLEPLSPEDAAAVLEKMGSVESKGCYRTAMFEGIECSMKRHTELRPLYSTMASLFSDQSAFSDSGLSSELMETSAKLASAEAALGEECT